MHARDGRAAPADGSRACGRALRRPHFAFFDEKGDYLGADAGTVTSDEISKYVSLLAQPRTGDVFPQSEQSDAMLLGR